MTTAWALSSVTGLAVARERELGTFEQLLVSPLSPTRDHHRQDRAGLVIGVGEATGMILVGVFYFRVPLVGSVGLLYAGMVVYLLAVIGVGLFISSLAKTQQQAILGVFAFMCGDPALGLRQPDREHARLAAMRHAGQSDPLLHRDRQRRIPEELAGRDHPGQRLADGSDRLGHARFVGLALSPADGMSRGDPAGTPVAMPPLWIRRSSRCSQPDQPALPAPSAIPAAGRAAQSLQADRPTGAAPTGTRRLMTLLTVGRLKLRQQSFRLWQKRRLCRSPTNPAPRTRAAPDGPPPSDTRRIAGGAAACAVLGVAGCTSLRQWWPNGCKVGPDYAPPPAPVAECWLDFADPRVKHEPVQDCAWWTVFDDATLSGLVETAYRQNLDLRAAATRILAARAQRGIAVGNLFPQSQRALGTYVHGQVSRNLTLPLPGEVNVWADGFNASWEADFWGRFRRAIESADADLGASVENYGDTLVMLLGDVATAYVQFRTFQQRLLYAQENVVIQTRSAKLAEDRFAGGKATELDMRQARSNLAQTQALIPPLVTGRQQAANRLCILLGMPVSDLGDRLPPGPIPTAPVGIAVGIPADLLRRRPDIAGGAAGGRPDRQIGIAEADLYPRLAVNGFLGYAASDLHDLFSSKSFLAFVIPSLQWNILNYGRIANNIRAQDARLETVALQYQQAVLSAGREVEDGLIAFCKPSSRLPTWTRACARRPAASNWSRCNSKAA